MMSIFKRKKIYEREKVNMYGHTFTILDPFTMPKVRQAAYHLGEYEKGWGITKENLVQTFEALKSDTSFPKSYSGQDDLVSQLTNNLQSIQGIIDMVLLVIKQDYQYDPFIKSACNIILIDDEKADAIEPEYQKMKLQLCNQYQDIMVFFLITERNSMKNIEILSDMLQKLEQLEYPKDQYLMEKRLLSSIKT